MCQKVSKLSSLEELRTYSNDAGVGFRSSSLLYCEGEKLYWQDSFGFGQNVVDISDLFTQMAFGEPGAGYESAPFARNF